VNSFGRQRVATKFGIAFVRAAGVNYLRNHPQAPQFTVVGAGTLDDPSSVRATTNMSFSSATEWACLDPTLQRVDQQPAHPKVRSLRPDRPIDRPSAAR